ncbi:H(+)/Cl(-) exchange transporter ClcA [Rubripirellula lacrimiformis]|uniref:H(+)/Cl(-) exchange transporter ClcA n=1 Tax=Rubripirellula lacrimiformis TaxID=1930273 RepID=A0A517N561_9BACT|nr:chloride channel protein [Rubripirellula lacrimiformis]QDT02275.1 H(+)/Cl(-) exchange transporter ClcA [Rubripirellula lacrimiformis]
MPSQDLPTSRGDRLFVLRSFLATTPSKLARGWRLGTTGRWSLLAALVGLLVGACCIVFDVLTQLISEFVLFRLTWFDDISADGEASLFSNTEASDLTPVLWGVVLVMTVGGFVSGWLVYRFCPEAAGAGTDASADAFHQQRGMVRARVVVVKTLASAITLGTGGSGGREGPIAQIGAAIGSSIANKVGLSVRDRRILLAAGMGAGVGAMFRAPLAGAIFAAEILYSDSDMEADVIVPSAIASIVGYSVYTQSLPAEVRFEPLFGQQLASSFSSPLELMPYTLLTVVLLALAGIYVKLFHGSQAAFAKMPGPAGLRPGVGACLAGLLGVLTYVIAIQWMHDDAGQSLGVLGTGYGILQASLTNASELSFGVLLLVCIGKALTTSMTIGSGGSGGVFGPSLVIGGCAGAAFGKCCEAWLPGISPSPEACAIVGMAGFFAGVARAPISTILIVRELTGDFALLAPTLFVTTLMFLMAGRFAIYKKQVSTRLESPAHRGDFLVDVLEGLRVQDVYRHDRKITTFPEGATLDDIVHRLAKTTQHYFPVVDQDDSMVGIFSDDDVRRYLYDEAIWRLANAEDVMVSDFVRVSPNDDLHDALQKFTAMNLDELPVIDEDNPGKLLGFLRRKETIAAYNRRILQRRREVEQHT